jgi:hypothetical protein
VGGRHRVQNGIEEGEANYFRKEGGPEGTWHEKSRQKSWHQKQCRYGDGLSRAKANRIM